jgi:eukaryotic-like serine/threonine-protein kinase
VSTPSSCIRCTRPLEVESASGLCTDCLRTANAPASTSRDEPLAASNTGRVASPVSESPRPVSAAVSHTRTFVPRIEPATATVIPDTEADFEHLPPAPAGYELIREIGSGGMGTVYLAWEVALERDVAIKFLQRPGNHAALERFLVEVRALALLDHPHIISVLASDFLRADPFFTTEYVPGGSLSKKVEANGPFEPMAAARLMATAARAVHTANVARVIHRDVKPSNILLAADGTPRIADFGLAKRLDRDDELTTATGPLGTPRYMAPEQTGRKEGSIDARTDVYGLGATLYYLITGQPPFTGSPDESIKQIQNDPPTSARAVRDTIPRELEAIVLKCLEKDPARRYQTAEALAIDLDRFVAGQVPDAPLLTWPRRVGQRLLRNKRRLVVGSVMGLSAVGLVTLGGMLWSSNPGNEPITKDDPPQFAPGQPVLGLPQPRISLAQVQERLRKGGEVVLMDEKGPSVPLVWEIGSCEIVPSKLGDTDFSLRSSGEVVLRVLSDPGIDRYRLRAVIRQDMLLRDAQPVAANSYSRVGLSLGHNRVPDGENRVVHVLHTAGFCDSPPPFCRFILADRAIIEQPLQPLDVRGVSATETVLDPTPNSMREIEVDVTPETIVARTGGKTLQLATRDITAARAAHKKLELTGMDGQPIELPLPSTRLPIGLWASGCWASIKKLTICPLP